MNDLENIDGYVSKDSLYRLLATYRMTHVLTDNELNILVKIAIAIKDMPNEGEEVVKHGYLINKPKALDPSEQPVMCSVCRSVTSLYHGYKPRYCSDCGAKFVLMKG